MNSLDKIKGEAYEEGFDDGVLHALNEMEDVYDEAFEILEDVMDDEGASMKDKVFANEILNRFMDIVHELEADNFEIEQVPLEGFEICCEDCDGCDETSHSLVEDLEEDECCCGDCDECKSDKSESPCADDKIEKFYQRIAKAINEASNNGVHCCVEDDGLKFYIDDED